MTILIQYDSVRLFLRLFLFVKICKFHNIIISLLTLVCWQVNTQLGGSTQPCLNAANIDPINIITHAHHPPKLISAEVFEPSRDLSREVVTARVLHSSCQFTPHGGASFCLITLFLLCLTS